MAWTDGILNIAHIFASCNFKWLWLGLFIMAFCWFIESYIVNIGLKIFNKKLNLKESIKNCILGQFFSNITPSATGGQPFQAYYMNKCGINFGTSFCVLLIKFICYQICLTFVCGVLITLNFKELFNANKNFSIVVLISFLINAAIVGVLFLIGFQKKITISIARVLLILMSKLKLVKNFNEKFEKTKLEIEFFNKNFIIIFKNKRTISYMLLLTTIQIVSFHALNVAIALVLNANLNLNKIYKILTGAACVQISSTFIPLPGAVGGTEMFYYVFYSGIFTTETLSASLLLWRIYSFYIPIVLGLLFWKNSKK